MSWVATAVVGGAVIGGATSLIGADKAADASKDATALSVAEQRRQYDQSRADFAPYREVGSGALTSLADIYGVARPSIDAQLPRPGGTQSMGQPLSSKAVMNIVDEVTRNPGNYTTPAQLQALYRRYPGGEQQIYDALANAQAGPFKVGAPGTTGTAPAGPVDRTGGFTASPGYQFRLSEGTKAIQRSAAARGKLFSGDALKAVEGYAQGVASDEFARHVAGLQSLAGVGQSATNSSAAAGTNAANNISQAYMQNGANIGSSYMAAAGGVNNAVQGGISNWLLSRYLKPA